MSFVVCILYLNTLEESDLLQELPNDSYSNVVSGIGPYSFFQRSPTVQNPHSALSLPGCMETGQAGGSLAEGAFSQLLL